MASHLVHPDNCVKDPNYAMCGKCGHGYAERKGWKLSPAEKALLEQKSLACPKCGCIKRTVVFAQSIESMQKEEMKTKLREQAERIKELEAEMEIKKVEKTRGQFTPKA